MVVTSIQPKRNAHSAIFVPIRVYKKGAAGVERYFGNRSFAVRIRRRRASHRQSISSDVCTRPTIRPCIRVASPPTDATIHRLLSSPPPITLNALPQMISFRAGVVSCEFGRFTDLGHHTRHACTYFY